MDVLSAVPLTVVLIQVVCLGSGYPTGAPPSTCVDMRPRHGVAAQASPAPYTLRPSARAFRPGQPITVVIAGPVYQGVLLEARTESNTKALGSWQAPPPNTKLLRCSERPAGAVTQANTTPKDNSTMYTWMPVDAAREVFFIATVAQERNIFWMNIKSEVLTGEGGEAEGPTTPTGGASRTTTSQGGEAESPTTPTGGASRTKTSRALLVLIPCFLATQMILK